MNFQPDKKEKILPAPAGWITASSLLNKTGMYRQTLDAKLNSYRSKHPEWFKDYLDKNNFKTEHLHPDLVKAILEPYQEDDAGGYRNS